MHLADAFSQMASRSGPKTAIFWGDEEYTYEQLLRQTNALAAHLRDELGVQPGHRVGVWLRNRPEFVPVVFGVLRAGAVVVPINNFLKAEEVNYILADAGIDLVITDAALADQLPKLTAARPRLKTWLVEAFSQLRESGGDSAFRDHPPRQAADLAVLIYTSGTTGRPKGAMLSHANLLSNVVSCRQVLTADEGDRFVVLLPMFHSFMLTVGIFLPLLIGGSIVLIKSLHPPKNILEEIFKHRATILPAIPQFFRTLANAPRPPEFPLRACISGGAPLPAEILREFNAKMPIPLVEGYGLSEASPVVSINPLQGSQKAGSIGVPIPGVEVSIQSEAGAFLPPGQTGEVCVRGPNVMLGYWNQPEETAQVFRDGWLLTGDVGHRDEEGYFFITDRKKDMLLVNGINVYPREIEEVIYRFPGVREAAVIGIPDARKGEQPLAFIVCNEGSSVDEKALGQFLRGKLADYKVPKRMVVIPALPRNATGKVLKTTLRAQAAGREPNGPTARS